MGLEKVPPPPPTPDDLDPRKILIQTGVTLAVTTVVAIVLMILFSDQVRSFGKWFVSHFGAWGFFGFAYITDALIVPGSIDLTFPLMAQEGLDPVIILSLMCIGSILGGSTGWFIGHFFDHFQVVHRMVEYYRSKGERLIKRFGFWAVVIAAVTPVPYSTVSWIAGLMKVPFPVYFLASLFRIPRIVVMYLIITGIFISLPL